MSAIPPPAPPASGRGVSGDSTSSPLPLAGGAGGGSFRPRNTKRARALRAESSPAERRLWQSLSNRQLNGFKFSRQMPVGPFFADFLCRSEKLIIELDGYSHEERAVEDQQRDAFLVAHGYRVLRFSNADVETNLEGITTAILLALSEQARGATSFSGELNP